MKRYILTLLITLIGITAFAQETPPSPGPNFKLLTTNQWYWQLPDSIPWQYKGVDLGWSRIARFKDLKAKLDKTGGTLTGDVTSNSAITASTLATTNNLRLLGGVFERRFDVSGITFFNNGVSQYTTAWPGNAGQIATVNDVIAGTLPYQLKSEKGQNNGYAGLDAGGKVPLSQINASLIGAVNYQGTYDAGTNTPALPAAASGNKGWYYVVSAPGTQVGLTLSINDWVISNGSTWGKVDNNNIVSSVAGKIGIVTLNKGDVGLGNVDNTSDLNKPLSTATISALANKADDNLVMHLAGTETATGNKLFSGINRFSQGTAFGTINDNLLISATQIQKNVAGIGYPIAIPTPTAATSFVLAENIATGQTIGANTTGNAASTTLWGGDQADFTSFGTNPATILAEDITAGKVKPIQASTLRTFLGIPSGGETLQSVTARGNTTDQKINISSNTNFGVNGWQDAQLLLKTITTPNKQLALGYSLNGDFGYLQAGTFGSTYSSLLLNPNGGNVGVTTLTPLTRLHVSNIVGTGENLPTLGTFGGSFAVSNNSTNYGINMGATGSGESWIQVHRSDGTATAYNLNLQPSGGTVTVPTPTLTNSAVTKAYVDAKVLTASATLDFPSTGPGTSSSLQVTVTGAVAGDPVIIGGSTSGSGFLVTGRVVGPNTVSVECSNYSSTNTVDLSSSVFKIKIFKD
ncbi:hypothetical protein [Pedobacter lusitanus]|uniref:hypothetical protein n=1 Tax=Pedobacter lusitanus TaxID=1503925 RepID=UPI000697A118|nr:hypothetical protein [Pedobacter lusitanus]